MYAILKLLIDLIFQYVTYQDMVVSFWIVRYGLTVDNESSVGIFLRNSNFLYVAGNISECTSSVMELQMTQ